VTTLPPPVPVQPPVTTLQHPVPLRPAAMNLLQPHVSAASRVVVHQVINCDLLITSGSMKHSSRSNAGSSSSRVESGVAVAS
jgi:hypothetical protein